MSDLKLLWETAKERHGTEDIISREIVHEAIKRKSGGVMDKLRKSVLYKMWFSVFSFALLIPFIILSDDFAVIILLTVVELAMLAGVFFFYKEHKELKKDIDITANPRDVMTRFSARIRRVIHYEEMIGLTMYPLSASAGFIIGVNADPDIDPFFNEWHEWVIFFVVIAILTPLCHWLTKWMNRITFKKLLNRLEENIQQLDTST
ncbi:hypothetical protein [Fulvivirga sedimenti]|uniref:Uncharacterized protein n=1 Tax=Fulvivirga sedimenti TaxID=2879465 RepID=A0A9X1HR91_9BACT|nr:hypothetical protein [Fulvivirga sedimenti]MCA6075518.1 hypothetical protein [Fulvivirga sedimenti]MCA6076695.1 hypothetical protein [Fulvivirga sedimenti]MCA6077823.1 hypothetical protein [Fulvivirga sedimenti]